METLRIVAGWLVAAALVVPQAAHASAAEHPLPFADIEHHQAKSAIVSGYEAGWWRGTGKAERFEPDRLMTRGELFVLFDRILSQEDHHLFPLTLLTESDQFGWGDGFDEPYLPYTDVDRLTWLYPSVLRISLIVERMYGPGAMERLFGSGQFHPSSPATREDAEKLVGIFAVTPEQTDAWLKEWKTDSRSGPFTRGEAAMLTSLLDEYLRTRPILPLLNFGGTEFPVVPEISEMFPLFEPYSGLYNAEEMAYRQAVSDIVAYDDGEDTYETLRRLAASRFPNRVGVHYYLSWNPDTPLTENWEEAFLALDSYFAAGKQLPDTLRLLCANVYDLALLMEEDHPKVMRQTRDRLLSYERRVKSGSGEAEVLSLYLGVLEAKIGLIPQATDRFLQVAHVREGAHNALYYLIKAGKWDQAKHLIGELTSSASDAGKAAYLMSLARELSLLERQGEFAERLEQSLRIMEQEKGYEAKGESMFNGYLFKYTHQVDHERNVSRTTGYLHSPDSLVLEKMDIYADEGSNVLYRYDFAKGTWVKRGQEPLEYLSQWVERLPVSRRLRELDARYLLQTAGPYDIITEWVPEESLREQSLKLSLSTGTLKRVPSFVNKYYIERSTNRIVGRVWRYEEVYDSDEYTADAGQEWYSYGNRVQVSIPDHVRKGAVSP